MEWREETPCVPKRLGPLALLLALLTMSCLKSPSSTARIPTAQVLLASARSNSTSGLGEVQEVGIAMDAACHGKDLGRWLIVDQSMDPMYLQVVPIKMKAEDAVERQNPRTRCCQRRETCSNEENTLTSPSFLPTKGYHLLSRPSCRVSWTLTIRRRKKLWTSSMVKQLTSKMRRETASLPKPWWQLHRD